MGEFPTAIPEEILGGIHEEILPGNPSGFPGKIPARNPQYFSRGIQGRVPVGIQGGIPRENFL